jgi:hypothetical protein
MQRNIFLPGFLISDALVIADSFHGFDELLDFKKVLTAA